MNTSIPAIEQSGRKLKDHRQGKQSYSLHSAEDRRPQKSISEFLSTSKQGARSSKTQDLLGSSSNKRLKLDHPTSRSDRLKLSSQAVTAEDMYSLPSAKTGKNDVVHIPAKPIEVIDISDSPPGSPHKFSPFQRTAVQSPNSATYTGPKRLVVKNLKKAPRADPQQYFTQVWDQLNTALSAIFKNNNSTYSREELYRGVETLCRLDWASALFDKLCEKCGQEILILLKEPLAIAASTGEDADILRAVIEAWSAWNSQLVGYLCSYNLH